MIDLATIDLTTVVIIAGILGYLIDRFVDARGWSRSSRTLRRENEDLVRRNVELEATLARHEIKLAAQTAQIGVLESKISELQARDQSAVLHALTENESQAERRHAESVTVWTQIRDALPTKEAA